MYQVQGTNGLGQPTTTSIAGGGVNTLWESPKPTAHPCPSCGHCPNCGRGGWGQRPWYPSYPYPYWLGGTYVFNGDPRQSGTVTPTIAGNTGFIVNNPR